MAKKEAMEDVEIVTKSFVSRAIFYRRLWMAGWVVATLAITGIGYVYGLYDGRKESLRENQILAGEIRQTAEFQAKVTTSFVDAWQDLRSFSKVNVSWAEYVREREVRVDENRGRVVERTKR